MSVQESFDTYCKREGITSEQYKEEIEPVWFNAFRAGVRFKLNPPTLEEFIERVGTGAWATNGDVHLNKENIASYYKELFE